MTNLRAPTTEARDESALAGARYSHYGNVRITRAWPMRERLFSALLLLVYNSLVWYTPGKLGHCRMRVNLRAVTRP